MEHMFYQNFLSLILDCNTGDIAELFIKMDKNLIKTGISFLKNEEIAISAQRLWSDCIGIAASTVFGDDAEYIVSEYQGNLSEVVVSTDVIDKIVNFSLKHVCFRALTGYKIKQVDPCGRVVHENN